MTILVLTRPNDGTAGGVVTELERRGVAVVRADVGDFPLDVALVASLAGQSEWRGYLDLAGNSVRLDEIHDVRLTVVGDRFFAVAIHASSDQAYIDWRSDYDALKYEPIDTPEGVRYSINTLLERLDLPFGAFDFTVTPDGQWWFLELNPNGQWGWIEDSTDLPITTAVADLLTSGKVP